MRFKDPVKHSTLWVNLYYLRYLKGGMFHEYYLISAYVHSVEDSTPERSGFVS